LNFCNGAQLVAAFKSMDKSWKIIAMVTSEQTNTQEGIYYFAPIY
jgi:hypothetical protein